MQIKLCRDSIKLGSSSPWIPKCIKSSSILTTRMHCTTYSPCESSAGRVESDSTDRSLVQASEHYPASAKSQRALLTRTLFMWRAKRLDATTRTCISQTDWYCHLALLFGVFQSFNQYVSNEVPFCQKAHQLSAGEYVYCHTFVDCQGTL